MTLESDRPKPSDHDLLIRMDEKLSLFLGVQKDHTAKLEEHDQKFIAVDSKIRTVNEVARKAVTPKQLWLWASSAVAAFGTVAGTVMSIINWIGQHK